METPIDVIITLPAVRITVQPIFKDNGEFLGWLAQTINMEKYALDENREQAIGQLIVQISTLVYIYA